MRENELLEQKDMREKLIGNIEVLDKVKEVILLPYGESMTTEMVAEYFEVGKEAINSLVKRNREELEINGLAKIKRSELEQVFESSNWTFKKLQGKTVLLAKDTELNVTNTGLIIFTRRTILNVAMLLRDSEVAKEIRTKLLDMTEDKEAINKIVNDIDEEKLLMLNIMTATDDITQMMAISKLKKYRDDKENIIKEERNVAVEKVGNLTKSDATWGLREVCSNIGVKQNQFSKWLRSNKYMYKQRKRNDVEGKPTGRMKAISEYTKEPTRYFTDINQIDRDDNTHTQTVFTVEGVEYFRTKIEDINKFKESK